MNEVIQTIFHANLSTLLIVASLVFLFIAVAGSVAGKIDPGNAGRIAAGITGAVLLVLGIVLRVWTPEPPPPPPPVTAGKVAPAVPGDATPLAGVRFFGRVLYADASNQRFPLRGARVELRPAGTAKPAYFTTSERDGVYAFPSVPPGSYEITVREGDVPLTVVVPQRAVLVREGTTGRQITITVRR